MSREQLSNAILDQRTKEDLTQVAAAAAWKVDVGLIRAAEDPHSKRRFGVTTLAPLDRAIGESAYKLFKQADDTAAVRRAVDKLAEDVAALRGEVEAIKERNAEVPAFSTLELVCRQLADDELAEVLAFAHYVMSKRAVSRDLRPP